MSSLQPFFLQGSAGRLFALLVTAPGAKTERAVLYLPPFAEEMNRSRRMAALQARKLAATGAAVLLLDLYGTGDSEGDFRDARWELWLEDVTAALQWLRDHGYRRVSLWGLRLGALLAAEVAAAGGIERGIERLILWQPVVSGDGLLTQFLRIRVAAGMDRSRSGETTATLKSMLMAGKSVEVAGYEIAPELARALFSAGMGALSPAPHIPVHWLEVASQPGGPPLPASLRIQERWRAADVCITIETVAGEPFWALQEITLAPNLFEPTIRALETGADDRETDRLCVSRS